jgi:hypothetical protein
MAILPAKLRALTSAGGEGVRMHRQEIDERQVARRLSGLLYRGPTSDVSSFQMDEIVDRSPSFRLM